MPEIQTEALVLETGENAKGIFDVLGDICLLKGGFAEQGEEGILETLLPPAAALAIGLEEEMHLSLIAGTHGSRYAGYGSETLEAFAKLMSDVGMLTEFAIHPPHHIKSSGFEKLLQESLVPINGLIKLKETEPLYTPYYLFNLAYIGQADEKRQGMVSVWMNALTGASGIDMGSALDWRSDRINVAEDMPKVTGLNPAILQAAMEAASQDLICADLDPWRKSLARRRKRDEERVKDYFQSMASEIRNRAEKKQLAGEDLAKEKARASATERELDRKLEDLTERYRLRIKARVYSCQRVYLPTVHLRCEVIRKRVRKDILVVYNPFSKCIEPLRCEKTHKSVKTFELSDDTAAVYGLGVKAIGFTS
jgi:hypothetical protein